MKSGDDDFFQVFQNLSTQAGHGKIFHFKNVTRAVLKIPSAEGKVSIYEADSGSTVEEASDSGAGENRFRLQVYLCAS